MKQEYDLNAMPILDSMHDQRAHSIDLKEKTFILHYKDLHYDVDKEYHSCDVIFFGVEDADIVAEVRRRNGLIVEGIRYYDTEFLEFINNHNYSIETIYYYRGYEKVIIEAALVDVEGKYCEDCVIKISTTKVIYYWQ